MIANSLRVLIYWLLMTAVAHASDFVAHCQRQLNDHRTTAGEVEHWFFSTEEIRHLSLGDFWQRPWSEVARNQSNPVPMMLEFQNKLQAKGVKLLIVPVPAKATIYPEKFAATFGLDDAQGLSLWIRDLNKLGLNVLDLKAHFHTLRSQDLAKKYWCAQDSHFSPLGAQEVANLICRELNSQFALKPNTGVLGIHRSKPESLQIQGDLVSGTPWAEATPKESVSFSVVSNKNNQPLTPNLESRILLLGDSHTLVFSEAEGFHCEGAGLFDQLSYKMGEPIDLEGTAGGGLVTSRLNLYQKVLANPNYWQTKKAVVWVFSAREITQSSFRKGFISVPIEKKQ